LLYVFLYRVPQLGLLATSRCAAGSVCAARHSGESSEDDIYPRLMSVSAHLRPSSLGIEQMLVPVCNRSALLFRSDSERNWWEMTVGLRSDMDAYFIMSPGFRTTLWPWRHLVHKLRLIPTIRQASELLILCFIR